MQKNNEKYIIFGCGGHARSIADVILCNDKDTDIIFLDENAKKDENILGFPVVNTYNIKDEKVIVGIGNNLKRKELSKKYYNNLVNVVSKNAYIGKEVKMGRGIFIAHNAHVGILSEINDFAIVNTCASIDHECILKEGSFVAPNATLCGKVKVGKSSFIGANATIIDGIEIADNVTIGAGSVVIKDIIKSGTYIGIPAKQKGVKTK